MLAPMAPFATEELWREVLGERDSVHASSWPGWDAALVKEERVTLVLQVDGDLAPVEGVGCHHLTVTFLVSL